MKQPCIRWWDLAIQKGVKDCLIQGPTSVRVLGGGGGGPGKASWGVTLELGLEATQDGDKREEGLPGLLPASLSPTPPAVFHGPPAHT